MRWINRLSACALALMAFWINGCGQGPQTAAADNGDTTTSNDLARFITQTTGGLLDLTDLSVGDRLVIDVRNDPDAGIFQSSSTSCECNWMVTPTTAGTIEKSDSCLATLTLGRSGPADLTVVRRCGFELNTFRQTVNVTSDNIAIAAADKLVADAGADITVREGDVVTLDGTESRGPDRAPIVYTWTQINGPPVMLADNETSTPFFRAPLTDDPIELTFSLTVSDGDRRDGDEITVRVAPFFEATATLEADAGDDQFVLAGSEVTLVGKTRQSGSGDVEYKWTQMFGPTVALRSDTSAMTTFTAPESIDESMTLVFEFSAKTSTAIAFDTTNIIVESAVAPASDDGTVDGGDPDDSTSDDDPIDDDGTGDVDDDTLPADVPVALSHSITTTVGSSVILTLHAGGNPATQFRIDEDPCNGQLTQVTTVSPTSGRVLYIPNPEFRGIDRFTFTAQNAAGISQPATVSVTVGGPWNMRCVYSSEEIDNMLDENGNGPLPRLLESGVRDFVIKINWFENPVTWSTRLRIERWAAHLHGTGAKLWPLFNMYAANDAHVVPSIIPYVNSDGDVLENTPCPTDDVFWTYAVTNRMVHFAQLAGSDPGYGEPIPLLGDVLGGILIDLEMYASDVRRWDTSCYCEHCMADFLTAQNITASVPAAPTARFPYLEARGLVDDYDDFQQAAIRELAAGTREAVHAVDPCITIGGTAVVRNLTHYRGISQGFGTPRKPFIEMTQQLYLDGYNDLVPAMQQFMADENIFAEFVVGIWFKFFPPEALTDHYYVSAERAGGVWLNRSTDFEHPDTLCEDVNDYYDAIQRANAELDRLEINPDYVSPYNADPFAPSCFDQDPYEGDQTLVQLEPGPAVQTGMWIRKETAYLFEAMTGENISLDIEFRRFGNVDLGDGWWILLGPDGQQMASGALSEEQLGLVRVTATMPGIYSLAINASHVHAFRINNASHPGSYQRVGTNTRVNTWKAAFDGAPQLFAHVPAGESGFHLSVAAVPGERTQVILRDARAPDIHLFDEIIGDDPVGIEIVDRDIALSMANPAGTVIEIVFRNPGGAEDLEIRIDAGALTYLSQTRSGLLRQP